MPQIHLLHPRLKPLSLTRLLPLYKQPCYLSSHPSRQNHWNATGGKALDSTFLEITCDKIIRIVVCYANTYNHVSAARPLPLRLLLQTSPGRWGRWTHCIRGGGRTRPRLAPSWPGRGRSRAQAVLTQVCVPWSCWQEGLRFVLVCEGEELWLQRWGLVLSHQRAELE